MKQITLTNDEMNSLDWLIDYLNDHDSIIAEQVQEDFGECNAIDPIQDLCNIFNRSLDN